MPQPAVDVLALELAQLGLLLLEASLEQARLEDLDRRLLVLGLRPLVLALGDDVGRQVGQPDGRVGLVDVLPARALRAVGIDPDLVPVQLDVGVVLLDLGQDLDQRERRLAPVLRVERADPDEPVDAPLGAQPAVGPARLDCDGHALQPGRLALGLVHDLGMEPVTLGPAEVHPEEHLGPVGCLGPTGPRADHEQGAPLVVLPAEQECRPLALEVELDGRRVPVEIGLHLRIGRILEELGELTQRGGPGFELAPRLDLGAQPVGLAQDLLGGVAVVPETRDEGQLVELGEPCFLDVEVKDAPRSTGSAPSGP